VSNRLRFCALSRAPDFCRAACGRVYLWVADPRQVPFLCSCKEKEPKESTPRSRLPLPALLARAGAAQLVGRLQRGSTRTGARLNTPGGAPMLGGGYGNLKTPPCKGSRWAAPVPVGANRAPQREERREPRGFGAAKRPGVLLFGDFLLDKQEKVTLGRGRSIPDSNTRPQAARQKTCTGTESPANRFSSCAKCTHKIKRRPKPPLRYRTENRSQADFRINS
jgi:hypothetical protein